MESRRPYWQVAVSLIFSLLATAAFVFIGIKVIVFLMPFVIGWFIAAIAAPLVNWLEKRLKIVKKLGSALIVIVVLALIVLLVYFIISRVIAEIGDLAKNFPHLYAQLEEGLHKIGDTLSGVFDRLPDGIQKGWNAVAANMDKTMGEMMSHLSRPTVSAAGKFAKSLPSYLIAFVVAIMSAYFFTIQREEVIQWMKRISPPSVEKRMRLVSDNLKYAVGGYLKAQFKIMGVVFVILFVGLLAFGVHYAALIAILIAFLDFLPFFGTGTAMIPWAFYEFFMGDYKLTVALAVIYVITQVVRQMLQPKLMGDSMGLNPVVTLLLLYVGYKISSVLGMILAVPLGLVLINMYRAKAFDYIMDDVRILVKGILALREEQKKE